MKINFFLTINSDLAVTIRVTGLKKRFGLSVGQSSGTGREVLQEQPGEDDQREILSIAIKNAYRNQNKLVNSSLARPQWIF